MDMLSHMDQATRRLLRFPMVAVGPNHPLSDPNRPAGGTEAEAAASLLSHYERGLRDRPLNENPLWDALKTQASAVRIDQLIETPMKAPTPSRYGNVGSLLVGASLRRSMLNGRIDEALPAGERASAKAALHGEAVERSFNPAAPERGTGLADASPEVRQIWDGPTGRAYRDSLSEIATAAKTWAARQGAGAHDARNPARADARTAYADMVGSIPEARSARGLGWTRHYDVEAMTPMESRVTRTFVDIALNAVDRGRDPTPEMLATSLESARQNFERPLTTTQVTQVATEAAQGADGTAGAAGFTRPVTREHTVQPALAAAAAPTDAYSQMVAAARHAADAARMEELKSAHAWPLGEAKATASREDETRGNAARLAVAALMPDRALNARLIDQYDSMGDALKAAATNGTGAAAHGLHQATRDRVAYATAVNTGLAYAEAAAMRQNHMLTDPRDPLVAINGMASGFSAPAARNAAQGTRIAIVGDEKPLEQEEQNQINKAIWSLADVYGRDKAGRAQMRVTTTLTPGVGEAVMEACLRHNVPVEAIGHKDDYKFFHGSDDHRLLGLATRLQQAGLGGTWTLHKAGSKARDVPDVESSRSQAIAAALSGSDAIIAGRMAKDDVATLVTASAGREKALFALPAVGPNPEAWSGTKALSTPNTTVSLVLDRAEGARSWQESVVVGGSFHLARDKAIAATVQTGAGAMQINRSIDLDLVVEAARGHRDASLARNDRTAGASIRDATPQVRYDVLSKIDYDRMGDEKYVDSLGLKPGEKAAASLLHGNMLVQDGIDELRDGRGASRNNDLRRLVETVRRSAGAEAAPKAPQQARRNADAFER